ncbi:MAG TPA: hypothetical protein VJV79_31635 [Polyangiaceae bacterium]|nr:hypothetical protein [Polyangiaceae bacterium]
MTSNNRLLDRMIRRSAVLLAASLVGCASPPSEPTRIEVLAAGYVINETHLASPEDLKTYLSRHGIRNVHLIPKPDASYARVYETLAAVRDAGASIGLVGAESKR